MARQKYAGSYGYCKDLRLHIKLKLHFDQPIFSSLTMGGTLKIKASELPNEISIELRHHTETRVQYRKGQIFADPRRCPLALALQEVLTNIGIRYEEAAIYDFYGEIVLPNKQIFRAWHSKSVEGFVRGQDNRWQGEAPLGVYRFDWSAVVKRRRRAPDITELIGS